LLDLNRLVYDLQNIKRLNFGLELDFSFAGMDALKLIEQ
jgi:hypothetical protein